MFFSALRSHSAHNPVYQLLVSASWKSLRALGSQFAPYIAMLPNTLPAQPSWEPVGNIIIVEDPGDLYNSHRGHMASSERAPGAKIEGVLNLPGVKEKIGQKVEKNDSNQFVVDLYKQSTTFHRCQREELEKNGSNQFVLDLNVNGNVERDKNATKKSS